ncbi:MAG: porphobilinogen synthase [Chlamydiales bacterium]
MLKRPRRNRRTPAIRSLVSETLLSPADLVACFFVVEGKKRREEIPSLPQVFKLSVDELVKEAEALHKKGIPAVALFPIVDPSLKNFIGDEALNEKGVIPQAILRLKKEIPTLCVITDIALDPFTSHGHDGLLDGRDDVDNDKTLEVLARMAHLHASCGVDFVAPSDMMDGRVRAIRTHLDAHDLTQVGIIAYTAKYASSLYAPYREALASTLARGDKKTYQMNPANAREALLEAALDAEEGADILLVKPGLFYLDIIAKMRSSIPLPICAFHVSGEYAMVMAAHEKGYLDAPKVFLEALTCFKRAGTDFVFSYAAPMLLDLL